eukprot:gene15457-18340_t
MGQLITKSTTPTSPRNKKATRKDTMGKLFSPFRNISSRSMKLEKTLGRSLCTSLYGFFGEESNDLPLILVVPKPIQGFPEQDCCVPFTDVNTTVASCQELVPTASAAAANKMLSNSTPAPLLPVTSDAIMTARAAARQSTLYKMPAFTLIPFLLKMTIDGKSTITSQQEHDFVQNMFVQAGKPNYSYWISGISNDQNSYNYDTGPEALQYLYNSKFDKCGYFCNFASGQPNTLISTSYLKVCEYGGLEDPFVPLVRTVGERNVTISNIGRALQSDTQVTVQFTNTISSASNFFACTNVVVRSISSISCDIPPGTGLYSVQVSVGPTFKQTTTFQYMMPFVSVIYPSYTAGSTFTVTGDNFGTDINLMSIVVSKSNIACTGIKFIKANAVSCVLQGQITTTNPLLPMTLRANGQFITTYKAAFVDGLSGQMGYVETPDHATTLMKVCPLASSTDFRCVWTSITYNTTLSRPKKGLPVDISAFPMNKPNLIFNAYSLNYTVTNGGGFYDGYNGASFQIVYPCGALTEFNVDQPTFINNNAINYVHTTGGFVDLLVNNAGTVLTPIWVTYRGADINITRDFVSSSVYVNVTAGSGGPYPISLTVYPSTTQNNQFIQYYPPTIESIDTPDVQGVVGIHGAEYSTVNSNIEVKFGSNFCSNAHLITNHVFIKCKLPAGSGTVQVVVTVDGQSSAPFDFTYNAPTLTSISPIGPYGGVITVEGDLLLVMHQILNLPLEPFIVPTLPLGLKDNSGLEYNYLAFTLDSCSKIPQNLAANITIDGSYFGADNIAISIDTIPCISTFFITQNRLLCYFNASIQKDTDQFYPVTVSASGFSASAMIAKYEPTCADPTCSGHGSCVATSCVCTDGWTSPNCSTPPITPCADPTCSGHGSCVQGSCVCTDGWTSSDCSTPPITPCADPTCSGHGNCTQDPTCSGHGTCVQGVCECDPGWGTPLTSCSSEIIIPNKPVVVDNGTTTNPANVDFETSIRFLREVNPITGEPVKTLDMNDITFTNTTSDKVVYLNGTFVNETVNVFITITTYTEEATIEFAGNNLFMPANSVKYLVDISSWPFKSQLNTLQVIYLSKTLKSTPSGCGSVDTIGKTASNTYEVKAGNSVLQAKFSDHLYTDKRIQSTSLLALDANDELVKTTTAKNDTEFVQLTAVQVPNFLDSCQIDPNLSSLILQDDVDNDQDCDKKQPWKIPSDIESIG